MEPLTRLTPATGDVLEALLSSDEAVWGLRIVKQCGRPTGSVYPILERLERSGWITSRWDDDATRPGPRRRLYELTGEGRAAAIQATATLRQRAGSRTGASRPAVS